MKTRYFRVCAAIAFVAAFAAVSFAQTRVSTAEKFIISAKAGAVNIVMGDVTVERTNSRTGRLFKGDELQTGEKVSTGVDGKAEILMNPGSYFRMGANSSFEFDSTDLDEVRIKMHKGSAIFEVFGAEEFTVDVKAGKSRFAFVDTGIYRVDVAADGDATVSIVKGKVLPGLDASKAVKSGKRLEYNGAEYAVAKFDKDVKDDLAIWSAERAKLLSQVAQSLRPSGLRDPLISAFHNNRWNLYSSFGVWVYDPFFRSYCFLPFGYGWNSPYGYGYGRSLWYYNMPQVIYQTPPSPQTKVPSDNRRTLENRGFADAVKRSDPDRGRKMANSDGGIIPAVREPQRQSTKFDPPPVISMPRIEPIISAPIKGNPKQP